LVNTSPSGLHDARAGADRALKSYVGIDQDETRFDHVALVGTHANAAVQRATSPMTAMIATNKNDHHGVRPNV
jgi:hypothetical protein